MNIRHLSWRLLAIILLTMPLWHGEMAQFLTLEQARTKAPSHQDSRFMLEEASFSQIRKGTEELLLRAKRVQGIGENGALTLEDADARRLGPRPVHITGGSAIYDPRTQILTILDHVVVETTDLVVKTEALRYLTKFETLKSAANIEMVGRGLNITGTSFMYNLGNGALRVGERVRCLFTPTRQS